MPVGDGSWREGDLNCMQIDWLLTQPQYPTSLSHEYNTIIGVPADGASISSALDAVRAFVCRHEALRTVFDAVGAAASRQRVAPPPREIGAIEHIVRTARPGKMAQECQEALRTPFQVSREWPIRVVLETAASSSSVRELAVICDHSAVDMWGMVVTRDDITRLLGGNAAPGGAFRRPDPAGPVTQPLDVTEWERSPAGRRHAENALVYWLERFAELAEFAVPADPATVRPAGGTPGDLPHHTLTLSSSDLNRAATTASRVLGASPATIFLAVFGMALCELFDAPAIGVLNLYANRNSDADLRSVSKMFMKAPIVIRRPADGYGPAEIMASCQRQTQAGRRFARVDRRRVNKLRDALIPDAGSPAVARATFNYIPTGLGRGASGLAPDGADETIHTEPVRRLAAALMLMVVHDTDCVHLRLTWRDDLMEPQRAEWLLRSTQARIVELACGSR
ncbi:hypothetical protein CcI49_31280 [Frankia sp. CcI49]|uniref:condensation domain-containing protein n=1 Tax=unclassified Frankia TaxID=2632575 RepID=UPI0006C9F141|nr:MULTISPECIES: condensation domain-containing protein [unclassified Frankia]ONH54137.1 hypothetical protein CcI49_31280 [Frankia sp. CcI49]